MSTQDQYLRQDVVAQQNFEVLGNTQLGNDASDITTVVGKMTIGGTTVQPVAAANYGPGPLTNEVIFSFTAASYDAAIATVTVVDDANADIFVASYAIAHDGTTPTLSSAYGQVDIWSGTDPTFNVNNNAGTIELRMDIADAVSVNVAVDAKLFAAQTSEFITISGQPANDTVVEGDTPATFSVTATSNDSGTLSYQWQVDSGGGFGNVTDDATYSGATTDTLTITTTDQTLTTYQYRCVVSSTGGAADATSNAATLTVNAAVVTISADPANATVAAPGPHTFTVTASTNETLASLTYQWEVDSGGGFGNVTDGATGGGGNYSGATTDSLAIDDVTGLDTYQYRCVVTSDSTIAPTATSAAATLTVT